jgi:hypothetical protein
METGLLEYTLGLATTRPGLYSITWPDWHEIPEDWTVTLYDRTDGRKISLRDQDAFLFRVDQSQVTTKSGGGLATLDVTPRFDVRVAEASHFEEAVVAPPQAFVLTQNFPNPFNPVTTFRYAIPQAGHVRLEVYDVLGRRVARVVNQEQAAGWHDVRWDAGRLPSGLYFYRIEVGAATGTRTMMLLQ